VRPISTKRSRLLGWRASPQGGECGHDAGKKVKRRKRHIVVDMLGLLLAVTVTAASVQDRDGAADVVA
jgi:putative transposase